MPGRKDEKSGIEDSEQDDEGDVGFDTTDEDDEEGESPADEVDSQISIEPRVQ